jgi:hypothetical protein
MINLATGTINTIAGNGTYGFAGDGGPALEAEFEEPLSVAMDSVGNFYIADATNYRIRRIGIPPGSVSNQNTDAILLDGVALENSNQFNWEDFRPETAVRYNFELSGDGIHFKMLGSLLPASAFGNSYLQRHPSPSVNYYRLEKIDSSGKYIYSNAVMLDNRMATKIKLFPNPAQSFINIYVPTDQEQKSIWFSIYDEKGRLLLIQKMPSNTNLMTINISSLANGAYTLRANQEGKVQSIGFIKLK